MATALGHTRACASFIDMPVLAERSGPVMAPGWIVLSDEHAARMAMTVIPTNDLVLRDIRRYSKLTVAPRPGWSGVFQGAATSQHSAFARVWGDAGERHYGPQQPCARAGPRVGPRPSTPTQGEHSALPRRRVGSRPNGAVNAVNVTRNTAKQEIAGNRYDNRGSVAPMNADFMPAPRWEPWAEVQTRGRLCRADRERARSRSRGPK